MDANRRAAAVTDIATPSGCTPRRDSKRHPLPRSATSAMVLPLAPQRVPCRVVCGPRDWQSQERCPFALRSIHAAGSRACARHPERPFSTTAFDRMCGRTPLTRLLWHRYPRNARRCPLLHLARIAARCPPTPAFARADLGHTELRTLCGVRGMRGPFERMGRCLRSLARGEIVEWSSKHRISMRVNDEYCSLPSLAGPLVILRRYLNGSRIQHTA